MKQIRKLLALVLACLTLVLALPSTALAANRGEPAGTRKLTAAEPATATALMPPSMATPPSMPSGF